MFFPLGISIFQEELSSEFSSLTSVVQTDRYTGKTEAILQVGKILEGHFRERGTGRKCEKIPRSCCWPVRERGKPF